MADGNGFSDALKKQQYGLIVVGSKSNDGEPNGMTANWTSQVSFDPQIVAVAIQSGSQTRKNIDETGVFSISILGEGTKDLSLKFTKKSTSGEGRLEGGLSRTTRQGRRCSTRRSAGSSAGWSARPSPAITSSTSAR